MKYVSAKFGNNANGGTSKKDSYLTVAQGAANDSQITVYDGKYLEQNLATGKTFIGIGRVIFDGTIFNQLCNGNTTLTNFDIINYTTIGAVSILATINKCFVFNTGMLNQFIINQSLIKTNKVINHSGTSPRPISNCSIYGTSGLLTFSNTGALNANDNLNVIIHSKPVSITSVEICKVKFWHLYSVPIDISADAYGSIVYDGTIPYNEGAPNLAVQNDLRALRERAKALYGGAITDYFEFCEVFNAATTDCFVNPNLDIREGFYLKPTSPSAKANYVTGKHIGAMPVARGPVFPTDYTLGSNINISGNIINPANNTEIDNTIEYTNAFDHSKVVLVEQWGEGIQDAPRNGDYSNIDRDTDIDANLLGNGATLTNNEVYVCEVESLSITDTVTTKNYAVGENCLVPATGVWTVTATLGVMRKLFTTKPQVIMVKHSRNDATLATANYLRYYTRPMNGSVETYPMCHVDANGIPVLGDADTGFTYGTHVTYGAPIRVQLRYEKRKSIMQLENAKS